MGKIQRFLWRTSLEQVRTLRGTHQSQTYTKHTTTTNNTTPQTPHALLHTTQHNIAQNITRRRRTGKERQRGRQEKTEETVCGPCGVCCVTCLHKYVFSRVFLHVMAVVPLTVHNVSIFFVSRCSFRPLFQMLSNVNMKVNGFFCDTASLPLHPHSCLS